MTRARVVAGLALAGFVVFDWLLRFVLTSREFNPGTYDLYTYFVPLYAVTFERLAEGSLPLWNPYHLCGTPWLATLQAGVFYPPHALYLVLPTHHALALSHVLHLLLLAGGTAVFARAAGLSRLAACVAGALVAMRGITLWYLAWPPVLEAAAWLPIGCAGVLALTRGARATGAALLALAAGMSLLAGFPQLSVHLVYAWAALLLARLVADRASAGLGSAAVFAGALLLGAGLAAVQLAPSFELSLESTRGTSALVGQEVVLEGFEPFRTLRRAVVGSPHALGLAPLALAPLGLLVGRPRWLAGFAFVVAASAFALAQASDNVWMTIYRQLPGVGWFRFPSRLMFVANFGVALLAALAVDAAVRGRLREGARRTRVALAAGLLGWCVALVGVALGFGRWGSVLIGLGVVLAVGAAAVPTRRLAPAAGIALALLAGADLFLTGAHRGRLYEAIAPDRYGEDADFYRALGARAGAERAVWLPVRRGRDLKLAPRFGLRWLDDFEPFLLRRTAAYFDHFRTGPASGDAPGIFSGMVFGDHVWRKPRFERLLRRAGARRRMLDLTAARYAVAQRPNPLGSAAVEDFVAAAKLERARSGSERFTLFENPHATPRAFVTYEARPAPPTAALLEAISRSDFDPLEATFVERDPGFDRHADAPARGHPATLVRDDDTVVEVDVSLDAPGLLVLADAYARGWRARVDGEPAEIVPANHLFRGVRVGAGRHRVRFEYGAAGVGIGAVVSAVALAATLALAFRARSERG